jgi:hypothetical protein
MQEYVIGKQGLILPKFTGEMSRKREMSPEAIEHWRTHLDLSDLEKSCKALYTTLLDLHQAKLSPEKRFESLNLLRPTVSYLSQSLMKLCPENKGIINKQHRKILALSQQLNIQLYHGYKIILNQTAKHVFSYRDLTFMSLHTCMHISSKLIFESHYQYRKPAKFLWKEIHLLYNIACKKKYNRKSLAKLSHWSSRFDTIEDEYKHILLFSISQPNHHTPKRLEQLKYAIESWSSLIQFNSIKSQDNQSYMVATNLDKAPIYIKKGQTHTYNKGFYINLDKVRAHLTNLHEFLANPSKRKDKHAFTAAEIALPANFISFLITCWTNRSERGQERLQSNGNLEVCLGINAIHWFLSKESPHVQKSFEVEEYNSDVIDLGVSSLPDNTDQKKVLNYENYSCEVIDESDGGVCLKWLTATDIPSHLVCGELIAYRHSKNNDKNWLIGNIRWLKENENKEILFGVQLISKTAFAANSWLTDASIQQGVCTLMLPENQDRPITLLTPSIPFKLGNEINIQLADEAYHASLQTNFSSSTNYQQYMLEFFEKAPTLSITKMSASQMQHPGGSL